MSAHDWMTGVCGAFARWDVEVGEAHDILVDELSTVETQIDVRRAAVRHFRRLSGATAGLRDRLDVLGDPAVERGDDVSLAVVNSVELRRREYQSVGETLEAASASNAPVGASDNPEAAADLMAKTFERPIEREYPFYDTFHGELANVFRSDPACADARPSFRSDGRQ